MFQKMAAQMRSFEWRKGVRQRRAMSQREVPMAADEAHRKPLLRWLLQWHHVKAPITAAELMASGVRPGPELGQRLRRERAALLDADWCDQQRV